MRSLLIEDEPLLGRAIEEHLRAGGHAIDHVQRLDEAEAALLAVDYDMVLLDLHLPDGRGLDLLRWLRGRGDKRPVLILTARDQVRDRIEGLNAGADDYLVKPFDLDELTARIAAVARRYAGDPSPVLVHGPLEIDRSARTVRRDGILADLGGREWTLLELLARRPGTVLGKEQLEEAIYRFGAEVESNAIEALVSRLRKKLGSDAVVTVRGLGYRLGP